MSRVKRAIATVLLPVFISQPGHALTYKQAKDGIQREYAIIGTKSAKIGGKKLDVYKLSEHDFQTSNIEQQCQAQPYLVLDGDQIVDDGNVYKKAALLAKYDQAELDSLYSQNEAEINRYRGIVNTAFWFELLFDITDSVSWLLADYLKGSAPKTFPKGLKKAIPNVIVGQVMNKFVYHIEKVLFNRKVSTEHIDSAKLFKEAMYDTLWDSAGRLENINKTIRELPGNPDYSDIKKITQQTAQARSAAEAALLGLTHYYGSDSAFRSAMNFLIEHVAKPVGGTEFESATELTGALLPDIERVFEPYMPALENFFANLEVRQRLWQLHYGEECIEIGMKRLSTKLRKIERRIGDEKMAAQTYKTVIERYLSMEDSDNRETDYKPKRIERNYSTQGMDSMITQNTAELERAHELASRSREQAMAQLERELERAKTRKQMEKRDFESRNAERLYIDIKASKKYLDVDIDDFARTARLPLEINYTVNRNSCVDINMNITTDATSLDMFFGEAIMDRLFWSEGMRHNCVNAGTYRLYPKEINCPHSSNCLANIQGAIRDTLEFHKRTNRPFRPFTFNIKYHITASSDSQRASDMEIISVTFHR